MPLSRQARERILDRLELLEGAHEATIDATIAELRRTWSEAVQQTREDVLSAFDREDLNDVERVAAVRVDLLEQRPAMARAIWRRWRERLEALVERADQIVTVAGGAASIDQDLVEELLGFWPTRTDPSGSGMAGRFANLELWQRHEIALSVTRSVLGQADRTTLVNDLATITGQATRVADRQFHDGTIEFSRTVTKAKADEAGYEFFEYVGPRDRVTRPFCRARVDKVFSRDEIDRMDNGQLPDVFITGGGHNCRHHWRPVRREWFDDTEWREMRPDTEDAT